MKNMSESEVLDISIKEKIYKKLLKEIDEVTSELGFLNAKLKALTTISDTLKKDLNKVMKVVGK